MKKILLALSILGAGAAAFHTTRQSAGSLLAEAAVLRESCLAETQRMAAANAEQSGLEGRVGELKQASASIRAVPVNPLWAALQTNAADRLSPSQHQQLREEFAFTWSSYPDYIVLKKPTLHELNLPVLDTVGKLRETAVAILAITPEERVALEAAVERTKSDFRDWVLARVKREEPGDEVVANYSLPGDTNMASTLPSSFFTAVEQAVGRERTRLIRGSANQWFSEMGLGRNSTRLTIRKETAGDETRLKVEIRQNGANRSGYLPMSSRDFPKALRILFPKGWADLAERERFDLPQAPGGKP